MSSRSPDKASSIAAGAGFLPHRPTLVLHYAEDDIGLEKRLLFEADTPASALEIAAGEAAGRTARLFIDNTPLCSLVKADEDHPYWIVAASAARPREDSGPTSSEELP